MRITLRQLVGAIVVSFGAGALMTPVWTQAQSSGSQAAPAGQPSFMLVQFMEVPEGKRQEWLKLEREMWKPVHQLRVKEGAILSWAAIAESIPGDDAHGPVVATVTTFRGWPDPTKTNWTELFNRAQPQSDVDAVMQRTESARRIVRNEIWQVLDQTSPAVGSGTN